LLLRDQVRPAIDAMFRTPAVVDKTQSETHNGVADENAGLVIHNGTPTGSLAARTTTYLQSQGFRIIQYGPVDTGRFDYARTIIIDYTGNPNTVRQLQQLFNVADDQIEYEPNSDSQVDVKVILGDDFQLPTPP
jgi:hypothetical protein